MKIILETERLYLREFTTGDAALIYELNIDPEVTRYTHDPVQGPEHANEVLLQRILPQYTLYGYGRWAAHLKKDHSFIGWCGLKYRTELDEVDLGYRFKKIFWGAGYATESARACVRYGLEVLHLKCITGRAEPGNIASQLVLQKCGLLYIGDQVADGHPAKTYEIRNT